MALVELSIVEQRYRAVLAVQAGEPVVEVAARSGVSRQTIHSWLARYAEVGARRVGGPVPPTCGACAPGVAAGGGVGV